jgi:uncharacterized protein YbjT (DUF2867 family)
VVQQALAAGHTVHALARDPSKVPPTKGLTVHQGDARDPASLAPLLDADIILSCLGTRRGQPVVVEEGTRNLLAGMAPSQRIAIISSIGVGDSGEQVKKLSRVFAYVIMPYILKRQFADLESAEALLRARPGAVIVRPAGLSNGPRTDRWVGGDTRTRLAGRVSRADVAAFMVSLVDDQQFDGRAVSVGLPK